MHKMGVTYPMLNRRGRGGKYLSPWQASEEHAANPPYNAKFVVDILELGLKHNWKGVSTGLIS